MPWLRMPSKTLNGSPPSAIALRSARTQVNTPASQQASKKYASEEQRTGQHVALEKLEAHAVRRYVADLTTSALAHRK
jgi:hypothetical protein